MQVYPSANENFINSSCLDSSMMEDAQSSLNYSNRQGCGSIMFFCTSVFTIMF